MANFTYATLTTAIQNYTEVGTSVFTSTITDQFIENAEERIFRDVNIDAYRYYDQAVLVVGQTTYNTPTSGLITRALKLTDSSNNMWYLQKVDQTMLDEYSQDIATVAARAKPRYYAMYDGGSGTTPGYWKISPAPDAAYTVESEYIKNANRVKQLYYQHFYQ